MYIYAATGHGTVNVSADAIKCISTHMSYRRKYLLGENAITKFGGPLLVRKVLACGLGGIGFDGGFSTGHPYYSDRPLH